MADTNTAAPGANGDFKSFTGLAISGTAIAFSAFTPAGSGVYAFLGKAIKLVADTNTAVPGGNGNFGFVGRVSISGNNIAFFGADKAGAGGIYLSLDGKLTKLISVNDKLDGKALRDLQIGPECISGNTVTFQATFADGSEAIYKATAGGNTSPNQATSEPSTATLLAVGAALAALGGRRRQVSRAKGP